MPSRNGLIALTLKTAFLLAVVVGLSMLARHDWSIGSMVPVVGVVAGTFLVDYVRRGDTRLRAARGQVVGFLRSGRGRAAGVPRKWKPGLATPSIGRLDFQSRIGGRGDEYSEPVLMPVTSVGRERDITIAQALFRMGPTWCIVELTTPEGTVELAGPATRVRKAVSVLQPPGT